MADPSVEELKKAIKGILKGADLDSLSAKKVRKMLEEKFDTDFSQRKKEIDKLTMKMIEEDEGDDSEGEKKNSDDDKDNENGKSDAESEEDEVPKKKAKKSAAASASSSSKAPKKKKSASKADDSEDPVMSSIKNLDDEALAKKLQEEEESGGRRRRAAAPKPKKEREKKEKDPNKKSKPSPYSRPCHLSEALAEVVGTNEMPRPEVVKTLWSIVRERNLLDPSNKQFMLCDEQMEALFGIKRVRLFGMMKHLKKHITDIPK